MYRIYLFLFFSLSFSLDRGLTYNRIKLRGTRGGKNRPVTVHHAGLQFCRGNRIKRRGAVLAQRERRERERETEREREKLRGKEIFDKVIILCITDRISFRAKMSR
ncbi:hypothetical protein PUN28_018861 [Cardiocondyla obscurior]|uniref:Secreted protein n=1 Tax=Cardiocondyla obscurior TaxID=286306 RepID=A0AAW2EGP0_9HYME